VRAGSRFLYRIGAKTVEPSLVSVRSSAVDAVELCLDLAAAPGDKTFSDCGTGRVGR
jgi:16S rRNA C967 or C1407 C5-methylase (RsmB/RsmF family)